MTLKPWLYLAALLGVFAIAAGAYAFGFHNEHEAFVAYQAQQKADAEQQVVKNRDALQDLAQNNAAQMKQITQAHTEEVYEEKKRRDALLIDVRNLSQRVYVGTAGPGGRTGMSTTGGSGPGGYEAGVAALSVGSSEFFIGKFSEADRLAIKLAEAQQIIREDRKICNGQMPGA